MYDLHRYIFDKSALQTNMSVTLQEKKTQKVATVWNI